MLIHRPMHRSRVQMHGQYFAMTQQNARRHTMTSGTGDKLKGKAQEAVGKGKETVGNATGDERLQGEGLVDQAKGKVSQAAGTVKDKLDQLGDKIGEKVAENRTQP